MADISQKEMGLIIGLVLGALFLTLLTVFVYILYDRQRSKKLDNRHRAMRTPDRGMAPAVTGPNWTTINNSMVAMEMCETLSQGQPGYADGGGTAEQAAGSDAAAHQGGSDYGKGTLAAFRGWAQRHLRRVRSAGVQGRGAATTTGSEKGGGASTAAAAGGGPSQPQLLHQPLGTSMVVPELHDGQAVVMLQLDEVSEANMRRALPSTGVRLRPLGERTDDLIGLALGTTRGVSSPRAAAAATATVSKPHASGSGSGSGSGGGAEAYNVKDNGGGGGSSGGGGASAVAEHCVEVVSCVVGVGIPSEGSHKAGLGVAATAATGAGWSPWQGTQRV